MSDPGRWRRGRERDFLSSSLKKEFVSVILQSSHQGADYTWQMHCTDVSSCFIGTSPQGHEVNEANLSRHFVSSKYLLKLKKVLYVVLGMKLTSDENKAVLCMVHQEHDPSSQGTETGHSWKWKWALILYLQTATFEFHIYPQQQRQILLSSPVCVKITFQHMGKPSKWTTRCPSFCSLSATDINYGGFSQGLTRKVWEKSTNSTSPFSAAQPVKFNWGLGENVGSITSSKNFPQPLDAHVAPLHVSHTFHMCPRDITHYSSVYWLTERYSI